MKIEGHGQNNEQSMQQTTIQRLFEDAAVQSQTTSDTWANGRGSDLELPSLTLESFTRGLNEIPSTIAGATETVGEGVFSAVKTAGETIMDALKQAGAAVSGIQRPDKLPDHSSYDPASDQQALESNQSMFRAGANMIGAPKHQVPYTGHGGFAVGRYSREQGY